MVRIRDRGGGIPPELQASVMDFAYSTYEENEGTGFATLNSPPGGSSIAGLGYGLPLSKAYAEFFGGRLQIQSYHGWGTDIYVTLKSPVNLYVGHGPGQTGVHGSYSMTDYAM
ncbi:protein kinase PKP1 [Sugiyamaella lignohabitans]|uniref:Protein-serine/threonine kinase n=1 Tax=Sugiyamaella lignohabitans TaxID=796027 RepID=A0A167FBV8_9ASCO|nr:protein kinase PKP1 [Sugiyamaella lignohabitans]ANB15086.1 protein kinase PKP1 [Sugiyamaella lignohabitans]